MNRYVRFLALFLVDYEVSVIASKVRFLRPERIDVKGAQDLPTDVCTEGRDISNEERLRWSNASSPKKPSRDQWRHRRVLDTITYLQRVHQCP